MPFTTILGNEGVKRQLKYMLLKEAVGQSLLFCGPDGVGKGLFAEALAKELIACGKNETSHRQKLQSGSHPDLQVYRPEGKLGMHSIDALRRLNQEVYLYPYEADKKVFIIHDAERMPPASANALLKTFEEPAPNAVIILLSGHPEALLPTILSRCSKIHFRPVPEESIAEILSKRGVNSSRIPLLARIADGSISKALFWAENGLDPKREQILNLLSRGRIGSYVELVHAARDLSELVESEKKNIEIVLRRELLEAYADPKAVTAVQRQVVDKEVEGMSALRVHEQVSGILAVVMSWYRDVHLLRCGGAQSYLFNSDRTEALIQSKDAQDIPEMEAVEQACKDAQLAVARSSPLAATLEGLLLKLNLL